MMEVRQMLVRTTEEHIRVRCTEAFIDFLVFYPMGEKVLAQHLNFLVSVRLILVRTCSNNCV